MSGADAAAEPLAAKRLDRIARHVHPGYQGFGRLVEGDDDHVDPLVAERGSVLGGHR